MYGTLVFDDLSESVYVRMRIGGKSDESSSTLPANGAACVEPGGMGRGPSWMDITCSIPARAIESMASPLKRHRSRDFNCMNLGCVSKRGDAKCTSGLYPGVDFFV